MNSTAVALDQRQVDAIRLVIERDQDRILLKIRSADVLVRPHLERQLAETRVALGALEPEL